MKICFITHCNTLHGANRSMLSLIDGLAKYNISAIVLIPSEGQISAELKRRGITYRVLSFRNWMSHAKFTTSFYCLSRILINFIYLPRMYVYARKYGTELVYSNSSCTWVGLALARMLGKPHIWHIREYGLKDFHLHLNIPQWFFEYIMDRSDALIAVSKSVRWEVLGRISSRVNIIYNGVFWKAQMEKLASNRVRRPDLDRFKCCIIGQISESKNQKEAIKAVEKLINEFPNIELTIAGNYDNSYGRDLVAYCNKNKLEDYVRFCGYIDDTSELLAESDVLLMCSKNEAMGRVTAEAMSAGIPVIGYNNGGTAELIEDGITGFLYRNGYEELAEKLSVLIKNPEMCERFGRSAYSAAHEKFSIEKYTENVMKVIKEVMPPDSLQSQI